MLDFFTRKILAYVTGAMLLVIIGLSLNTWRLGNKVDGLNRENGSLELRLQTSNASIDVLTAEAADRMAEARARDERAREVATQARVDAERAAREREAMAGTISRLTGLTERLRANRGECEVDDEVTAALEGV